MTMFTKDQYGDLHFSPDVKGIKKLIKLIILGFFALILLVKVLSSFRVVEAGSVEVVKRWGEVTGQRLDPGLHFIVPFMDSTEGLPTRKLIYEVTSEDKQKGSQADYKDYPVDTNTSEGQQVDIYYTVRFSVDPLKATWIIQNIGSVDALVERIVKTESRIWARNVPREFEANKLYTGNVVEVQNKIEDQLRPTFENNGLVLDSVGIREIKFSPEYVSAIETKQIEAVKVDTAEKIAERAKQEKQARITTAEGQAKEQELQRETLTDELLFKRWIEAWEKGGSQVPTYMCGDESANFFMQLPR